MNAPRDRLWIGLGVFAAAVAMYLGDRAIQALIAIAIN